MMNNEIIFETKHAVNVKCKRRRIATAVGRERLNANKLRTNSSKNTYSSRKRQQNDSAYVLNKSEVKTDVTYKNKSGTVKHRKERSDLSLRESTKISSLMNHNLLSLMNSAELKYTKNSAYTNQLLSSIDAKERLKTRMFRRKCCTIEK